MYNRKAVKSEKRKTVKEIEKSNLLLGKMKYQLEKWQHSIWQKDTRFYSVELCQDLFGNWIIKRTWGSAVKLDFGRSNSTIWGKTSEDTVGESNLY